MKKVKKLPEKEFIRIYSKVPRTTVELFIKNKNGILLTKRNIPPEKGWWHFPGGTILLNETVAQAVQRVAQEELGIKVKIKKVLGVIEYLEGSGYGQPIGIVHLVKPLGNIVNGTQSSEVNFFKIFPKKTLPEVRKYLKSFDF